MRRKKILVNTDSCRAKTGYGRNSKEVLKYLYNTGKYEIVEFACGVPKNSLDTQAVTPWKVIGTIPDENIYNNIINQNPSARALINYGHYFIDEVMNQEKPDIFLGSNDIWAFSGLVDKPWWNKTNTLIHTTIDSLPILDDAFNVKNKSTVFSVWASFAKEAMNDEKIKVIHGAFDTSKFFKLSEQKRLQLREKNGIKSDAEIIGFVFRNQLRKSIPNLLQAFSVIQNQRKKALLLLHTNPFDGNETWNIPELIKKNNVDPSRVLFTTVCKDCGDWHVTSLNEVVNGCKKCK